MADPFNTEGDWTAGFLHDILGNVVRATDANGVNIVNEYDRASRVIRRCYTKPNVTLAASVVKCADIPDEEPTDYRSTDTPTVEFFYDGKGLAQQQSPNFAKGKLTKVTSSVSETQYQLFDNFGRMTQSAQITDGQAYTSKYTYNLSGALVEEEYPSGRKVRNQFEPDGDLLAVTSKKAGTDVFRQYASNFSYTASGGISQMRLGNGKWETAKFNTRLQVEELGLGTSAVNAGLWKVNYAYGELAQNGTDVDVAKNTGNIAKQTLTIPGASFVQTYRYDSLYRLKEAVEPSGGATPNWTQTFDYDRYGNRTAFTQTVGGVTTHNSTPAISANSNRFTSTDFLYDKNGNVVVDFDPVTTQPRQFTFNADNKQIEVIENGVTVGQYFYDGEGKRVKKVAGNETTVFVYSSGKLVAEYATTVPAEGHINYTTTDHLGSPRVITNELGKVESRRDFMPFGEDLPASVGNRSANTEYTAGDQVRQKFTGYQKDEETKLDFAEARMYENRFGRFTAIDPLLSSGKSANPQTFNRYAYTSNNPVIRIDINGKEWYYAWRRFADGRTYAVPKWCSGFGCSGTKWTSEYRSTVDGRTTLWRANGLVFRDNFRGGYIALDPFENRQSDSDRPFNSMAEAQAQVTKWKQQAMINFIAGALNGGSLAVSLSGADGLVAETSSEMYAAGQRAGIGFNIASGVTGVGLANALVSRFGSAGISIFKSLRVTEGALSQFAHAGKFGFGSYDNLRGGVLSALGKGSGLHVHHLIEKRFAGTFGVEAGEMTSIVLTQAEHAAFTRAWRELIPYGTNATREQIENAAREVYRDYPDIIKALGLN